MNKENVEPKKVNPEEEKSDDSSRSPGTDRSPSTPDKSDDSSRSPGTDRGLSSSRNTSDNFDNSPGTDRSPSS